ncbi:MAG: SUMF1/EgtB/PvdO family nonheme iron enzyme [Acidobacteria bacterium]|nr:SUMF1/EgtB/PvdO family nonheme iron enzyme [Acidobacteriota bacterium]
MSSSQPIPPKVFISYSHDSHEHLDRVLALADRLRAEGIDCNLDQYEPAPAEGWPRWMDKQFKDADYILVVCTETYCRRFEGREERGKGLGVKWEGAIITDELYSNEAVNKRFIPVLFSDDDAAHVPQRLQHYMRHLIAGAEGYEELYRRLANQPRVVKPQLGRMRSFEPVNKARSLPSEERQQDFAPIEESPAPKLESKPERQRVVSPPKPSPSNFTEDLNGVKLEMIYIAGGEFSMGSNDYENEKPQHRVKLSPFFIGKYQITQAQWKAVMGDNPSNWKGGDLPVEQVSWNDAVKFCEAISKRTGKTYRLPTEAEWEYACRAGSTTKCCFGDGEKSIGDYAWWYENSDGKIHPVGQKKPNAWGLYDMHGNVWEWCSDWCGAGYYAECERQGAVADPQGPGTGSNRVNRGGGWGSSAVRCRSAVRVNGAPGGRSADLGFRLVRVGR